MKRLLVGGAVLALGIGGMSYSQAAPAQWKVTGGGQIIVDTEESPASGPGQTLAFNAQSAPTDEDGNAARGQLQYNDHASVKYHGVVTCLLVTPADGDSAAMATLGGNYTDGDGAVTPFKLTVTDNGQGQDADDVVAFETSGDEDCSKPADGDDMQLGRGNIVIHKEKAAK